MEMSIFSIDWPKVYVKDECDDDFAAKTAHTLFKPC